MSATPPRVLYLIASHTLPAQLARLVRRLRAETPAGVIAVHHDPTGAPLDRRALAEADAQLVPDARPVRWADFSQVEMVLVSFEWCLRRFAPDWIVLLSGQDYPVRPLRELESLLAATRFDGFVEGAVVPPPRPAGRWLGRGVGEFDSRYFFRYVQVAAPPLARRLLRRAWGPRLVRDLPTGKLAIGLPRARVPYSDVMPCRRGSAWYTLSRRRAEAVSRARTDRPELLRHYARTFVPDESLVQTLLHGDPALHLSGDYMRFTSWDSPRAAHPSVLRLNQLAEITSSGAFFARKFDERIDAAVLDALDAELAAAAGS